MLARVPPLRLSLDPLIREAKRRTRGRRRVLAAWLVALIVAGVVGGLFASRSPGGPGAAVGEVKVTENGRPVVHPTLIPPSQATKKTFGAVLVLDTSWSMHGKPLAAAVAAEQAFAARRNPNTQLGLIEFNRTTKVVLPLTTSATKITAGLAAIPPVAVGMHIYDAVAQAEEMLTAAHIGSATIVVLSDGADRGSTKTLDQVAAAARQANVRIDTVGVKDTAYRASTLRALAAAGNGTYAEANARQLARLARPR